ncbi:MAG: tetratricopeptide repeat protein [Anaerolineales bacterium]|nr:tetratricopeptide repeat protein [Anaerolineales bacterium]
MLRIRLLGEFSLIYGEQPVSGINSRRLQSLLAYLVLHRHSPQSRRYLAFLFWPDSTETQAHTNLRKLLHQLHRVLPDADQFLHVDAQFLQWRNDAPFTLDVADFERALTETSSTEQLQEAVDLYRGDLLPDCYDDWILSERERLHQMLAEILEGLIAQLESDRDFHKAIAYAQRLVRHDPLLEEAYRHLMGLYARRGDRAGIVRTYQTCEAVLRRELDIGTSPVTRAVFEQCLQMAAVVPAEVTPASASHPEQGSNNLPLSLSRFIGRERERSEVQHLVLTQRLVTLSGAGGIGKTRLALAAAGGLLDAFIDGVWHIDLAPLSDPELVTPTVAAVLGVREESGLPLLACLVNFLRQKRLLLILDNCEHLVKAVCTFIETVMPAAPGIHILVTSRIVLGMASEASWRVPALAVPESLDGTERNESFSPSPAQMIGQYESVQVFVDRAVAVLPTFALTEKNAPAVAQICRRLDGIPLALELAAAWVRLLTVAQIAERLDDALQLLAQERPTALPRRQTLRATLDWSHSLLTSPEQVLFRRLAAFAGSFTLEAAEFVGSGADLAPAQVLYLLAGLADKSLVNVELSSTITRFRLHEVTRQYACAKLIEAGEEAAVRNYHLDFYCRLAESLEANLLGTLPPGAFERLTQEYDNLQTALEWSTREGGESLLGLRLAAALVDFLELRGRLRAERGWLEMLLNRVGAEAPPNLQAKALRAAGKVAYYYCDFAIARSFFEQSLTLDREVANYPRRADTLGRLGFLFGIQGEYAAAEPCYRESLALYRALEDRSGVGRALSELGYIALRQGNYDQAHSYLEESLRQFCSPQDLYLEARARHYLGHTARLEGDYAQAHAHYNRAAIILQEMNNSWGLFYLLEAYACLAVAEAQWARAARLFGAVERLGETIGAVMAPVERVEYDCGIATARTALGEKLWAEEWAAGQSPTLDKIIAYAMEASP